MGGVGHELLGRAVLQDGSLVEHDEFRSVERKLDCMRRAGLDGAEAARYYRVFADLVLAYSAMDASLAILAPDLRDADLHAWKSDYLRLPADTYPNIARTAPRFVELDDPQNFVTAVQAVIDMVRAPPGSGIRTGRRTGGRGRWCRRRPGRKCRGRR